jgi:hypothetical protein
MLVDILIIFLQILDNIVDTNSIGKIYNRTGL